MFMICNFIRVTMIAFMTCFLNFLLKSNTLTENILSLLVQPGRSISDDPEPPDVLHVAVLSSLLRMWKVVRAVNKCNILFFLYFLVRFSRDRFCISRLPCENAARDNGYIFFDGQGRWAVARWPTYGRLRIETDSPAGLSSFLYLFIVGDFDLSFSFSFVFLVSSLLDRHIKLVIFTNAAFTRNRILDCIAQRWIW